MNWLIRLGQWWENRKYAKKSEVIVELDSIKIELAVLIRKAHERMDVLEAESQVPSSAVKDLAIAKVRLDQLELYVGLKRDPKPEHIPGAPKIS